MNATSDQHVIKILGFWKFPIKILKRLYRLLEQDRCTHLMQIHFWKKNLFLHIWCILIKSTASLVFRIHLQDIYEILLVSRTSQMHGINDCVVFLQEAHVVTLLAHHRSSNILVDYLKKLVFVKNLSLLIKLGSRLYHLRFSESSAIIF